VSAVAVKFRELLDHNQARWEECHTMGASGWQYIAWFTVDVASSLRALQEQVYNDGGYYFPDGAEAWGWMRGSTLDELWDQDSSYLGECGTHSILDIRRTVDPGHEPPKAWTPSHSYYNNMRPLTAEAVIQLFGHDKPTRTEYEQLRDRPSSPLDAEDDGRWNGRCVVLFCDGEPCEIAFWGSSGD
jgi:hypothetical protein